MSVRGHGAEEVLVQSFVRQRRAGGHVADLRNLEQAEQVGQLDRGLARLAADEAHHAVEAALLVDRRLAAVAAPKVHHTLARILAGDETLRRPAKLINN